MTATLVTNNLFNHVYASATLVNADSATFLQALGTGNTILGNVVIGNGPGGTPTVAVTDSKGNAYSIDKTTYNGTNAMIVTFSAPVTHALTTSDTITFTIGAGLKRGWIGSSGQAFSGILSSSYVDVSGSSAGTSSSPSSGSSGTLSQASEVIFGGVGYNAIRTFTLGGTGFTDGGAYTGAGSSSDKKVNSVWKIVNATTAQTISGTLDSSGSWAVNVVGYKATASNQNPVADAGPDQSSISPGATVTLNGSGSSDPDGTVASYAWSQTNGPTVSLSSTTVAGPTFTAPTQSSASTCIFQLIVTDNLGATSNPDTVSIQINGTGVGTTPVLVGTLNSTAAANNNSVALSAGVALGHTVILNVVTNNNPITNPAASATDTRGNTWTLDASEPTTAANLNSWVLSSRLTTALQSGDTINVSIGESRNRWLIQAYDVPNIVTGTRLDAATAVNTGSSTAPSSGTSASATTNANDIIWALFGHTSTGRTYTVGSGYTAGTVVETAAGSGDRGMWSEYKLVTSTGTQSASATLNTSSVWVVAMVSYKLATTATPPDANAGSPQTKYSDDLVTLSGSGTAYGGASITGYAWSQTAGATQTLSSTSVASPTFTAIPGVTTQTLTFQLIVTDSNTNTSAPATVTISVRASNVRWAKSGAWAAMTRKYAHSSAWIIGQ